MGYKVLDIKDIKNTDQKAVRIRVNNELISIDIEKQKTGFGYKRYLICPNCSQRRTHIYFYNDQYIYCRSCSPISPYEGITHTSKGGESNIVYRMYRIAANHNIRFKFPFSYYELLLDMPKHGGQEQWRKAVIKLQVLENMRSQTIFFKKKYSAVLIKHILQNCDNLPYDLCDIEKYLIDWHAIVGMLPQAPDKS